VTLLSDVDLNHRLETGDLVVDPLAEGAIGPASIDLRLAPILRCYTPQTIDLGASVPQFEEFALPSDGFDLGPGEFVLGMTIESIRMPSDLHGTIETKGDVARAGVVSMRTTGM
jgi:dCTP deaminase